MDIRSELATSAAGLEAASHAAMESLELAADTFAWFRGVVYHPMEPQQLLAGHPQEVDYYMSNVVFYGGRAVSGLGHFACGHIQGRIAEPLPNGAKHQSGRNQLPVPYVPRLFSLHEGLITVDTPSRGAPLGEGPIVVEGNGHSPRFRKTTVYDTVTGSVAVRSGELVTLDSAGKVDDRTVEQDAFELPDDILQPRLQEVVRTIKAASSIFDSIAWRDADKVAWQIAKDPARRRWR